MADVIKKVAGHSRDKRMVYQQFTEADASAGDVILVDQSIGKTAGVVVIEPKGGDMTIVFNPYEVVFKKRNPHTDGIPFSGHIDNLARRRKVLDYAGKPSVTIRQDEQYEMTVIPVADILIVSSTATSWTITVR